METPRYTFRERLARLFSTQVIVRKTGKRKIKVFDTARMQSAGTRDSAYRGRFTGVHTYKTQGYYTPNASTNFFATKLELYRDYEAMDEDPILSSALDIYADESTIKSPDGSILTIIAGDDKVKQILNNLFYDILNIEFNLWPWVRNICKYGDFYLALDLDEEVGIVNAIPMSAYDVQREEGYDVENPYAARFKYIPATYANPALKDEYEVYEVAHFRLLSDTNFLPYGRSMLESARKEFKRLALMEDAMMIHRIMRAPQRRVYKVSVGNLNPSEIDQYMEKIINKTKKIPYIDEQTGQYNLKFNLENMIEDIYIPVRGGDAATEVETLDGLTSEGFIEDVDYIKNKMMAALKIPRAFLGYDENLEGKAVLAAEDVRFARTIERIQSVVESELTKLAIIHLYLQGYTDASLIDFELSLNNPSIIYERQKVEILSEKINLISNMRETKMFSDKYLYENVIGMSRSEWTEEQELVLEDLKTRWRLGEIEQSGKDPVKPTVEPTPGNLQDLETSEEEEVPEEEKEETRGRPEETKVKFGSYRDKSNGRDPLGFRNTQADIGFTGESTKHLLKTLKNNIPSRKTLTEMFNDTE